MFSNYIESTMNSIIDFCNSKNILWFPINLTITATDKTQNGEIKYKKSLVLDNQPYIPKSTDFKTLSADKIIERQQLIKTHKFNSIAIDTRQYYQIDFDTPSYHEDLEDFKCNPFYKSSTKSYGCHCFVEIGIPDLGDRTHIYETDSGDVEVLANGWSWASIDAIVENADKNIQYYSKEEFMGYSKVEKKSSVIKNTTTSVVKKDDENYKYLNLVKRLNNTRIGGHDEWLKLTAWFASHYTKEDYLDFVSPAYHNEAESMWESIIDRLRPIDIHYICNLAKKVNLSEYKEWRIEFCQYVKIDVLNGGANDVAKYFAPKLKNIIVYCKNTWIYYNQTTSLWIESKNPDAIIISYIQDGIDEARELTLAIKNKTENKEEKDKLEKIHDEYNKHRRLITSGSYVSQLKKFLSEYIRDDEFREKLNHHPYKIAFKNGILDLETMKFRVGLKQDDYLTKTILHEWREPTEQEMDYVRVSLKKICNWNDKHLAYYLSAVGYAMTGDSAKEQLFWFLRGLTSQNGKSVIFEALEKIMPMYVCKATPDVLDKGAEIKKEAKSWESSLRILWLNEITTKKKDDELLKAICDGTNYKVNTNHAVKAETIPITFKLFGISNHSLNIQSDESLSRRFCMMDFNSQFAESTTEDNFITRQFVRDKSFNEKLTGQYKYALLKLVFQYSNKYFNEKKLESYPDEWRQEKTETMESNNKFLTWFNDNFELGPDYSIARVKIVSKFKIEMDQWKLKDELTRYKIAFSYDSQKSVKIDGKKTSGMYYGFRFKTEENDPEDSPEYTEFVEI